MNNIKTMLYVIAILLITSKPGNAQTTSQVFDQVADWSRINNASAITSSYNQMQEVDLSGDSLSWFLYYVSNAFIQTANYPKADSLISPLVEEIDNIQSQDLQIRLMLTRALLYKKQNRFQSSIELYSRAKPMVKLRIEHYRLNNDSLNLKWEKEKLTSVFINLSTNYYYLGNIETYGSYTRRALALSIKNDIRRQEFLTRRNLIEYFEITEQWDSVTVHLNDYAQLVNKEGNRREYARYKLREAVYLKNQVEEPGKAGMILEEVRHITDSLQVFQIWEDATYQLLHLYITHQEYPAAEYLLNEINKNPMVLDNSNALGVALSRRLQLYVLTNQPIKAKNTYKSLQALNAGAANPHTEALMLHAIIMYLTQAGDTYTASLMLSDLLSKAIDEDAAHTSGNKKAITYRLAELYTTYKYEGDTEHTRQYILKKILEEYKAHKIKDWVFESSTGTKAVWWIGIVLMLSGIGGGRAYWKRKFQRQETIVGSAQYQYLKTEIDHL